MTQAQKLLTALRQGPLSLNQVLAIPGLAAEYRRTMTDLRQQGYRIVYHKVRNCQGCRRESFLGVILRSDPDDCPATQRQENIYRLEAEPAHHEANGQLSFLASAT